MVSATVAKIALEDVAFHFDKLYSYLVPDSVGEAEVGLRVLVPFGKGNTKRQGIIIELDRNSNVKNLKSVSDLLDSQPVLTADLVRLVRWLKEFTFCTYFDAVKAVLPAGFGYKLKQCFGANPQVDDIVINDASADERDIFLALNKSCKFVEKSKLLSAFGFSANSTILETMLKKGLLIRNIDSGRKIGDLTVKTVRLCEFDDFDSLLAPLSKKQKTVCDFLNNVGSATVKEVCYYTGVTPAVVNTLASKNVVEIDDREVFRTPSAGEYKVEDSEIILSQMQQAAFDSLLSQYKEKKKTAALLYGVTGSGKTKIYIRLIDEIIAMGKTAVMMVPEISLTPQILALFTSRYGDKIAVFHSALSLGERLDEWKRVRRGEATIVLGTRSAVFAPLDNLGIMIIDEEQEHTYKSEQSPRYQTRDVARFRCAEHGALLLLGSATPSVESYARAKKGIYSLSMLNERYGNANLPEVTTVDLLNERSMGNRSAISNELFEALKDNFYDKKQSILLVNRRGYNTFASCRACGAVITCPNCSISMTYHHANGRLMCHYCGHSQPLAEACPECGKKQLRYSGFGTQRIEEELGELLPEAKILRMDMDTTSGKNAHEKAFSAFAKGEYDILLGTQMVAKGLDFENVTLVGVVSADQQLYNDDFRSSEKAFSLLTQVIGRAGRGKYSGKAIIQTITPENGIIKLAERQDYSGFYKDEIAMRKLMTYPPFCEICVLGFVSKDENKVRVASKMFFAALTKSIAEKYTEQKVIILGPVAPRISKISGKFRYRLIIKCKNNAEFRRMLSEQLCEFGSNAQLSDVSIFVDMNPESIF